MGLPQPPTPSSPHLYPQALQLKLYQAFIFSIPILFSIILFLLFYLFYLKRRASTLLSPPQILPRTSNQATTYITSLCQIGLKEEVKEKLPIVSFDEDLKKRESQCCVCLGEFELKEELLQIPSCKHVFHIDCIHRWLHSNSTCPLCRCFVILIPTTKLDNQVHPSGHVQPQQHHANPNHHHHLPQNTSSQQQEQEQEQVSANSREHHTIPVEGTSSSSVTTHLTSPASLPEMSTSLENNGRDSPNQECVISIDLQTRSD